MAFVSRSHHRGVCVIIGELIFIMYGNRYSIVTSTIVETYHVSKLRLTIGDLMIAIRLGSVLSIPVPITTHNYDRVLSKTMNHLTKTYPSRLWYQRMVHEQLKLTPAVAGVVHRLQCYAEQCLY